MILSMTARRYWRLNWTVPSLSCVLTKSANIFTFLSVMLQKDKAWSRKQCPSSSRSSRISRNRSGLGTGLSASAPGRTSTKSSVKSGISSKAGSETGRATIAVSSVPSDNSLRRRGVTVSRNCRSRPG
jgi:hypothetical protein